MSFSEGLKKLALHANNFETGPSRKTSLPFYVGDQRVGLIRADILAVLHKYPGDFRITDDAVTLASHLKTFEERSDRLAAILEELRVKDIFATLRGWRDECFDVQRHFGVPPVLKLERSATALFGIKQFGVHINGYLDHPTKGLCMWIARRSPTKQTFPGKLDQMVAGGLASGENILQCACKECREEASVPEHLLDQLKPVGTISYFYEDERGLFPECQFIYDLVLPEDFTPVNADGEVHSFQLMKMDEVKKLIITDDFKFNSAFVIVDFLIRHGLFLPDEEPNYAFLMEKLHLSL